MNLLIAMFLTILIAVPVRATGTMVLTTALKSEQLKKTAQLGSLKVVGVGNVNLSAKQSGNQLTVQAIAPDGKIIGQAESITGVRETPVAIITPSGLMTLTIIWERP